MTLAFLDQYYWFDDWGLILEGKHKRIYQGIEILRVRKIFLMIQMICSQRQTIVLRMNISNLNKLHIELVPVCSLDVPKQQSYPCVEVSETL